MRRFGIAAAAFAAMMAGMALAMFLFWLSDRYLGWRATLAAFLVAVGGLWAWKVSGEISKIRK